MLLMLVTAIVCTQTKMKMTSDDLRVGSCHGKDFKQCINKCGGMKYFKECTYDDQKEVQCQCEEVVQ